jgi:hypothetical protein
MAWRAQITEITEANQKSGCNVTLPLCTPRPSWSNLIPQRLFTVEWSEFWGAHAARPPQDGFAVANMLAMVSRHRELSAEVFYRRDHEVLSKDLSAFFVSFVDKIHLDSAALVRLERMSGSRWLRFR